jgi:hypothetical protein
MERNSLFFSDIKLYTLIGFSFFKNAKSAVILEAYFSWIYFSEVRYLKNMTLHQT